MSKMTITTHSLASKSTHLKRHFAMGSVSLVAMIGAFGTAQAQEQVEGTDDDTIVVVGSRISGAQIGDALPVTVMDREEIDTIAAVSGEELFLSIPQAGDVSFNQTSGQVSSNFARGDVGSIDIRNLGIGNTLVLINGRRGVNYPSSQASSNLAPVLTFNSNTIPVNGVERVEVLRDGAGAIYGSDAVAGVVNTVLIDDYDGAKIDAQYGNALGTNLREINLNGVFGKNFDGGRGNITLFANYTDRTDLVSSDQDFTSSADKRFLFEGTDYEGDTQLRNTSTTTPWGVFQTADGSLVSQGGVGVTNSSGIFHLQPATNVGCRADTAQVGVCIDDGNPSTTSTDENLRWDNLAVNPVSVLPDLERLNLFATGKYELTDNLELFGEGGYYRSNTKSVQDSIFTIGSIRMTVPATNYWNPFGPVTFADGSVNPNRLPGIDAPAEGVPVILRTLRFSDLGPTTVRVKAEQFRALAGVRGQAFGLDWETAFLYSEASVDDRQQGIDATLFQQNLALSTPDAFNPFNGGDLANPGVDTTVSSQAAIDAISIEANRRNKTTLFQWDLSFSRPDAITMWAGDVGFAGGLEFRRETQLDDRDPNVDGTNVWFDSVLGITQNSNLFGVSPTPDNFGSRKVTSAYVEVAVPLVSPEMGVPLMRSLDLQLAGRFEHYSDFGSVGKPKVAFKWDVLDGLRFRGSYSQGFRAPNLEQVNALIVTRGNTRTDWVRCEADLRAGRIASFDDCNADVVATARRAGNPDLKPETSENYSVGVVLEPQFIPQSMGALTLTADYWSVQQEGIVGVFGGGNALALDYLNRLQGSENPDVVRAAPTATDIAQFAGTGLDPVGEVRYVNDQYRNLAPQSAEGLDIGMSWRLNGTSIGDFSASFNAARLISFSRGVLDGVDDLITAQEDGTINSGTDLPESADLIQQNGNPKWRYSTSLTWALNQVRIGAHARYVGGVYDTSLTNDVTGDTYLTDSHLVVNLFGEYNFDDGLLRESRIRVGVRNLFDNEPPIADETYGYMGRLASPIGRYLYVNVSKEF
ncbi:TonB-dependent receptor plug domain-containing protein [Hyphococcus lacteus]|uniref:TonB-dependent receptor n=1 Tax=Hyphococcus lacteus TaxID=3143536 RepID=A0ABV3Z6T3_9PROT